ncbi:ankyrin repeat and SOCS box protein 13 isoform 2-T2 [Molossus nigricans]
MESRTADGCFLGDVGFWVERTPVHEAAHRGEALELQQLIENGACVNQVTVDSITPLHTASLQGQAQCVQLLLAAGAQVDARNIDGSTPLCDACASGSIECVKLLLSYGAKVNPPLYTASPLHEACMSGSSECVRLLIDVGANLEAHDCHFGTPLHVACAREHLDCVKVLLNAGANVNAAKLHETALHHAAKVKNVDLIEMLIEFGGNIYARDNRGKKPSDYTWSSSAPAKCFEHYESEARDASNPVTTLQSELEEGCWCQRAGENRQAEHPFPAHRLSFLQLSCRPGRREQADGTLAAGLAEPSVVCLKPSVAIDRTTFPKSLLAILFRLLCRLLENISKALGRPCLSFSRNFALTLVFPAIQLSSFTDFPQKDSWETLLEAQGRPGRTGVQGSAVDFHMPGTSRNVVPSLTPSAVGSPGGSKGGA